MIHLVQGKPYPLPIVQDKGQGAVAIFLPKTGSVEKVLQIVLPDMNATEQKALQAGMVKGCIFYEAGAMLLVFQFYGDGGKPLLTFGTQFDIRQFSPEQHKLHSTYSANQGLNIGIHGVDDKGILRVLRTVTMPPEMTQRFLQSVQEQLAESNSGVSILVQWLQNKPMDLIKDSETWILNDQQLAFKKRKVQRPF